MVISEGKNVVYHAEICRIEGCETKCADGVNPREYCVLSPLNSRGARYYIPLETAPDKLRELLTKDEILDLVRGMGKADEWINNPTARKQNQNEGHAD